MVNGAIAVVVAYLLGSFPSAYIVTRLKTGKDIRKLGGGNVGARNVYQEVGTIPAVIVGVIDIAKGAGAVAIALLLLEAPFWWVLAAGLAVVVGHIWSIFLKFSGGNGIATTIGILAVLMTRELLIALAVTFLFLAITRNPILSVNISLALSIPISAGFLRDPWLDYVVFSLILIVVLVLNFLPTAKAALAKAGSREKFAAELLRIDKEKEFERKTGKKRK